MKRRTVAQRSTGNRHGKAHRLRIERIKNNNNIKVRQVLLSGHLASKGISGWVMVQPAYLAEPPFCLVNSFISSPLPLRARRLGTDGIADPLSLVSPRLTSRTALGQALMHTPGSYAMFSYSRATTSVISA